MNTKIGTFQIFKTIARSDKRKNPAPVYYRLLSNLETIDAARKRAHVPAIDQAGKTANVHFTSLKTWKTRPEAVIGCQYGLYENWKETIYPDQPQTMFIETLDIVNILETVIQTGETMQEETVGANQREGYILGNLSALVYTNESETMRALYQWTDGEPEKLYQEVKAQEQK